MKTFADVAFDQLYNKLPEDPHCLTVLADLAMDSENPHIFCDTILTRLRFSIRPKSNIAYIAFGENPPNIEVSDYLKVLKETWNSIRNGPKTSTKIQDKLQLFLDYIHVFFQSYQFLRNNEYKLTEFLKRWGTADEMDRLSRIMTRIEFVYTFLMESNSVRVLNSLLTFFEINKINESFQADSLYNTLLANPEGLVTVEPKLGKIYSKLENYFGK